MPRLRSVSVRRARWMVLFVVALVASGFALSAADRLDLASTWRAEPIRIDGIAEDWQGRLHAVKGQRFSLGLENDADALYMCLVTTHRVLSQQIARQGLKVWLDPATTNPKKHTFGVHFPIDPRLVAMRDPAAIYSRDPSVGVVPGSGAQSAIGILSAKGDARRIELDPAGGIEARVGVRGDVLVFELKVPLKQAGEARPYAVDGAPGATVRFELETPEWRGPLPPQQGPIGLGIAVPAPGGRGMMGYPAMDATLLKPMEMKATLRLAAAQ
jgi:hypothetical protein